MPDTRKNGQIQNIVEFFIFDSTTGNGKTALAFGTSGLIISTKCDNEGAETAYTAAGSTIETIAALSTFVAPTSTKCRFKEVDAISAPGKYQFQFADARFAVSGAKVLTITVPAISGSTKQQQYQIQLTATDIQDGVRGGMNAMPNAAAGANGGLIINGANAGDLSIGGNFGVVGTSTLGGALSLTFASGVAFSSTMMTAIATATWNALTSGITTANSIGKRILDFVTTLVYSAPPTPAAIATAVENQIMDEADGRAVLAAIVAKINSVDTDLAGLSIAAIASASAAAILATPANKLVTDASGRVDLVDAPNATAIAAFQNGLMPVFTLPIDFSDLFVDAATGGIRLAASQPDYAPAKATDKMDLVDAPNATAITAIQSGLSKPGTAQTITPADTTAAQTLQTLAGGANGLAALKADTAAIKAVTDNLGTGGLTPTQAAQLAATATEANATTNKAAILTTVNLISGGSDDGGVLVNHSFGGTDALRVMHAGIGIEGAKIRCYLTSDYDSGLRNALRESVTGTDGRWLQDMNIDPDNYTLVVEKPQSIDTVIQIEVA